MYGRGKKHLRVQAESTAVCADLLFVISRAHKDHAKISAAVHQRFQGVQDDPDALVPHHPTHEQEHRQSGRQVIARRDLFHELVRHPAFGKIHTVGHDQIVPLIAQPPQILPRPPAYRPDLVTGGDILHQQSGRLFPQEPAFDGVGNVDIKLGVVGKDQGHMDPVPQGSGQDGGGNGAVAVNEIEALPFQPVHYFRRKRNTGPIAHSFRHIHAGIADHGKGKGAVIRVRVEGRHHRGAAVLLGDDLCIVGNGVGHTVYGRRKGVVNQADIQFFHWALPSAAQRPAAHCFYFGFFIHERLYLPAHIFQEGNRKKSAAAENSSGSFVSCD